MINRGARPSSETLLRTGCLSPAAGKGRFKKETQIRKMNPDASVKGRIPLRGEGGKRNTFPGSLT